MEFLPFFFGKSPSEPGDLVLAHDHLGRKELLHMAARNNGLDAVAGPLQRGLLSLCDLINMALKRHLQLLQFAAAFCDFPPQGFLPAPCKAGG